MLVEQYGEYKHWSSTIFTTHLGTRLGYTTLKWPHLTFVNDDKKEEKTRAFQLRYLHLSSDRVISAVLLTNRNGMNVIISNIISQGLWKSSLPSAKKIFSKSKEVLSGPLQNLKRFLNSHTARYFFPRQKEMTCHFSVNWNHLNHGVTIQDKNS